jgi:hypothetical protein
VPVLLLLILILLRLATAHSTFDEPTVVCGGGGKALRQAV